jgi:hypothetical protein
MRAALAIALLACAAAALAQSDLGTPRESFDQAAPLSLVPTQNPRSHPLPAGRADALPSYDRDIVVQDSSSCPPGFRPAVPSYEYKDRHFKQNGWVCEPAYRDQY